MNQRPDMILRFIDQVRVQLIGGASRCRGAVEWDFVGAKFGLVVRGCGVNAHDFLTMTKALGVAKGAGDFREKAEFLQRRFWQTGWLISSNQIAWGS